MPIQLVTLGTLKDMLRLRIRASVSEGLHERGPGVRSPLLGTPKDMLSMALEWASVSIGASLLGNMERHSFLGLLR
jgi:hypothetical protein